LCFLILLVLCISHFLAHALNLPELIVDPMSNRTAIYYEDPARPRLPIRIESRTASAGRKVGSTL